MSSSQPEVSILMTSHNKPSLVCQQVLSMVKAHDFPARTELLIYQSGGLIHGLEALIRHRLGHVRDDNPFQRIVVVQDEMNCGPCKGLNSLLALARGKYLYLTNDDMLVNTRCWIAPLIAALQNPAVGLVCSLLDNTDRGFRVHPTVKEMVEQIRMFAHEPPAAGPLITSESNQPWLVRAEDVWKFAQRDPIVNQRKWICELTDPTGMFWHVDWSCLHKVHLAGFISGAVPSSVVYHYDHSSLRDKDQAEPGWTHPSRERYSFLWGTDQKHLPEHFTERRFIATPEGFTQC